MGDNSVENVGIVEGCEVWIAAHRPSRLAGCYGKVIELDEELGDVLLDLGGGRAEWVRCRARRAGLRGGALMAARDIASIAGVEGAIEKVLAPLGLVIVGTTWKRDLKKGTLSVALKIEGLTDEQLQLFGGGEK